MGRFSLQRTGRNTYTEQCSVLVLYLAYSRGIVPTIGIQHHIHVENVRVGALIRLIIILCHHASLI